MAVPVQCEILARMRFEGQHGGGQCQARALSVSRRKSARWPGHAVEIADGENRGLLARSGMPRRPV